MNKFLLATVLLLAAGTLTAQAATVNFSLLVTSNTQWQLWVQDSTGNNYGLYDLSCTVVGANTSGIGHLAVTGPTGQIADDPGYTWGFTGLAQAAETTPVGSGLNFTIYQPATVNDPTEYVYTVAQIAGSFSGQMTGHGYTPQNVSNDAWVVPTEIAAGTMPSGVTPTLYVPDLTAYVFANESSTSAGNAVTQATVTTATPEPASLVLLGLGGMLILLPRKRTR